MAQSCQCLNPVNPDSDGHPGGVCAIALTCCLAVKSAPARRGNERQSWRDGLRLIEIPEAEATPLVGIGMLWGNNLSIDFQPGGNVAITGLLSATV